MRPSRCMMSMPARFRISRSAVSPRLQPLDQRRRGVPDELGPRTFIGRQQGPDGRLHGNRAEDLLLPQPPHDRRSLIRRAKAAGSARTSPSRICAWASRSAERSATSPSFLSSTDLARAAARAWRILSSRIGLAAPLPRSRRASSRSSSRSRAPIAATRPKRRSSVRRFEARLSETCTHRARPSPPRARPCRLPTSRLAAHPCRAGAPD